MTDRPEDDEYWEVQLLSAEHAKIRAWVLRSGLPDPTYDSSRGWALDEFMMCFEPALLQRFKEVMADLYEPPDSRKGNLDFRWIELGSELSDKLKAYLLDPRFRVEGYQPRAYEPTVIRRPMLQSMHPKIVISELVERGVRRPFRKFEHVRVFDQAARKKASGGRNPIYDWRALRDKLEREKPVIPNDTELVKWSRANVKPMPGRRGTKDGADDKTTRAAISKYGLKEFITPPG